MMKQVKRRETGSVLVESSLVLLVFMLMLLSTFDIGQVLLLHQSITERVREALRYGVVNTYNATAIRNYVLYGQTTAPTNSSSTFYSLTSSMVSVQRSDAGTDDDRVTITVSNYPYIFLTPMISGSHTGAPIMETLPYEGP